MNSFVSHCNSLSPIQARDYFNTLSETYLKKVKELCDDRYYNSGKTTIHDSHYDILLEVILSKNPKTKFEIGCKVDNKVKVTLPFILNSTDKIKETEEPKLISFIKKNPCDSFIISNKLNGQSGLIIFSLKSDPKLYTRGTSTEGRDISHFIDKIRGIPKIKGDLAVRGEIILKKKTFNEKYAKEYEHALACVVSVTNAKTIREPANDLEFVAYEIVSNEETHPEESFQKLNKLGFVVANNNLINSKELSIPKLKEILINQKAEYVYDIDGLILQSNIPYNRNNIEASGNPSYLCAFKIIFEEMTSTVIDVIWETSRWNILKPRINIEPIKLGGSNIKYCTGFNGKFISENNIGPGSIISIVKSGEVIPFITGVIKSTSAKMPQNEYTWNETGVDIISVEDTSLIKRLTHFIVSLGIEQINEGVITKLVDAGYDSPQKILNISKDELREIETFKDKMSEKIYNNIQSKLENVKLVDLMVASSIFGIGLGKKKLEKLLLYYPDLLEKEDLSIEEINEVEGFSDKTSEKIIENLEKFKKFLKEMEKYMTIDLPKEKEISEDNLPLLEKLYVFTGFRDKDLKQFIEERGGYVNDSISKSIDIVVTVGDDMSTKVKKAISYGIKIMKKENFIKEIGFSQN